MTNDQKYSSVIDRLRDDYNVEARSPLDRKVVDQLIDELISLSNKTDPDLGPISVAEKDRLADEALHKIGDILDHLAGWAIRHHAGQAILEQLSENRRSPEVSLITRADSHMKELLGNDVNIVRPDAQRRFAARILRPVFSASPAGQLIGANLPMALEALNYGETQPVVRLQSKSEGVRGAAYTLAVAKLKAICHVHYRIGLGQTKGAAMGLVSESYGFAKSTFDTWERRDLPRSLGSEHVSEVLTSAQDVGKLNASSQSTLKSEQSKTQLQIDSSRFSEEQLSSDAKTYHMLTRLTADWSN